MSEHYLFMLPLSPNTLFLATNENQILHNVFAERQRDVVMTFNKEATVVADTHVYATGPAHEKMIARYLRKPTESDDRHIVSGLRAALLGKNITEKVHE
jgi:DNA polymerase I-like protein with 3'-5' exonuclease and polymerase domains